MSREEVGLKDCLIALGLIYRVVAACARVEVCSSRKTKI